MINPTMRAVFFPAMAGVAAFALTACGAGAESDFENGQVIERATLDGVAVTGGGKVSVRHGPSASIRIIDGAESLALRFKGSSVEIRCIRPCPRNADRELEVTMPSLVDIAVTGGGTLTVEDGFPEQNELNAAVTGGGTVRAYALSAREVNAAVTGGGSLEVTATGELNAAVMGGGSVRYDGDPEVNASSMGGGSIRGR